jgi:alpha-ketoglutaric semialdehyde dehydrogenase
MNLFRNYINGEWIAGPTFENRNPANTDEVVGLHVKGTAADVDAAADAAKAALAGWSIKSPIFSTGNSIPSPRK